MRDCFLISRPAHRAVAGPHPVVAGRSRQPGLGEVIGQHFRLARRKLGEALLDRARGALMPLAPARQQQTVVGGVA